jgi:hypothetical protein
VVLALQHVVAMFGSTALAPLLMVSPLIFVSREGLRAFYARGDAGSSPAVRRRRYSYGGGEADIALAETALGVSVGWKL